MSSSIDKTITIRRQLVEARKLGDWAGYERLQQIWDGLPSHACKEALSVPIHELVGRYSGKVNGLQYPAQVGLPKTSTSKGYKVLATATDKSGQQYPITWYAAPSLDARNKPRKLALLSREQAAALREQLRRDGSYGKTILAVGSDAGDKELGDMLRNGSVWDVLDSGGRPNGGMGCFAGCATVFCQRP